MVNTTGFVVVFAGDATTIDITALDGNGDVVDISDATAIDWKLAQDEYTSPSVHKTLDDGITVTDGENGVYRVTLSAADTADLTPGTFYQASRITLDGNRNHVVIGTVWLRANVPA